MVKFISPLKKHRKLISIINQQYRQIVAKATRF